jgi:DNA polymerase-3 subunit beta
MSVAHFVIDASELQKVLHVVSPVSGKSFGDILSSVLFIVDNDGVTVKVTNGDIFTKVNFSCDIIAAGSFVAPSALLFNIIKECKNVKIEFRVINENDNDILFITAGNLKYRMNTLDINHHHYDIDISSTNPMQFSILAQDFKLIFDRILCCVDTKRINSNGVLFHSDNKSGKHTLYAVTTDRMRLAVYGYSITAEKALENIILPKKACDYIKTLLSSYSSDVIIQVVGHIASFKIGSTFISVRLIDADFPRYQSVIPLSNDKILDVKTDLLIGSINKVSAISTSAFAKIKMKVADNLLEISCDDNGNVATDSLEVTYSEEGAALELFCNANMLVDILQNINSQVVRFAFLDHKSQILIKPLQDNIDLRYVFMPIVG